MPKQRKGPPVELESVVSTLNGPAVINTRKGSGFQYPLDTTAVVTGPGWRAVVGLGRTEQNDIALRVSRIESTEEHSDAGLSPTTLHGVPWAEVLDLVVAAVAIPVEATVREDGTVNVLTSSDLEADHVPARAVARSRPRGGHPGYEPAELEKVADLIRRAKEEGRATKAYLMERMDWLTPSTADRMIRAAKDGGYLAPEDYPTKGRKPKR